MVEEEVRGRKKKKGEGGGGDYAFNRRSLEES